MTISVRAGHADGKLSGFVMGVEASRSVVRDYSWQAFPKGAALSALCSTPWGDLWSGDTRGSIRCGRGAPKPYAGSLYDLKGVL